MNEVEIKQALKDNSIIHHKKGGVYKLLGVGKGKLKDGTWYEGAAYLGEDGVYYTRPYSMFIDFKLEANNVRKKSA
tara:strand:- start:12043 stop:12270 length:228 start_codon:yes stop_codon:yes gene_type:complete